MTNVKLAAIADKAATDLKAFMSEAEPKLLEAWDSAVAEAQDQDTKPVFRLGFTVALDLDKDTMSTTLAFGVRHKLSVDAQIPDPDQVKLDLDRAEAERN